ncbi:low molecular weight protein-tyrosine-phosphatase [Mobilicoccus massiliensis]|uniref:low molecular weight protein-tyrosine-phosphatase n=1 Tax=Mobilicoccus massiliensis TaxID=1522310 RepID=UPI00058DEE1D|nr:low molecular weight protein-tyrosine-phosphatase [Mobilicoccus massiliensis]
MTDPYRVCVVCSGNICRSPMGEVVLREKLDRAGLGDRVEVDSAGTGDWHVGLGADPRTVRALADGGYDGSAHRARQFEDAWLADRDLVLVADEGHLAAVRRLAEGGDVTHVRLLRSFDPAAVEAGTLETDDPYYGDEAGFARCLREVEAACDGVVEFIAAELDQR